MVFINISRAFHERSLPYQVYIDGYDMEVVGDANSDATLKTARGLVAK